MDDPMTDKQGVTYLPYVTDEQGVTYLRSYIRMFEGVRSKTLHKMLESGHDHSVSLWKNSPFDKHSLMLNKLRQCAIVHQIERRYDKRHGYSGRTYDESELLGRVKHARVCAHSRPITRDFQ